MLESQSSSSRHAAPPALHERLVAALRVCARRATETGQPALLRLHVGLPAFDPWALAFAELPAQTPFFAWNDGTSDLCLAAWGSLQAHRLGLEERFEQARAFCSGLLEQVVDVRLGEAELDVDAPLCFAGFSFCDRPVSLPWEAWQGGTLYVPPTLVYRRGSGACRGVLCQAVDAGSDLVALRARLLHDVAALRAAASGSIAVHSGEAVPQLAPTLVESAPTWCERVRRAQAAAANGAIEKVVLARGAEFRAPPGQIFATAATLFALRQQHPRSLCFAVGQGTGGTFLGASPEFLVQVSGRDLYTQAVAGTAPRGQGAADDAALGKRLVESLKDRREHAVVVDVLSQALSPLCVALNRPEEPRLIRLPRVQHLETPFSGTLRQAGGILELVERLHPTPSVGGWPRAAALAWLAEHEPLDRGWYAGPVGWMTAAGDGAFAVAIRSVLLQGDVARAYAGAGVVAASDPDAEWRETELKLRTVRDALRVRTVG